MWSGNLRSNWSGMQLSELQHCSVPLARRRQRRCATLAEYSAGSTHHRPYLDIRQEHRWMASCPEVAFMDNSGTPF